MISFTALEAEHVEPASVESIAVYVHIPFCRTRCHYCAFYLETGFSPRVLEETLLGITKEAERWHELQGFPRINSLYIGGGTPSVIPPETMARFLSDLSAALRLPEDSPPREWTVEVNPESVGANLIEALEEAGVDRISLGVQSLRDRELSVLGRRSDAGCARSALDTLTRLWHGRLSIDLIVGIPGQTHRDLEEQIDEIARFGIGHVSCYGLTVEPGTALEQSVRAGRVVMPDRDTHERLWTHARNALARHGLSSYEVSNFAKPGQESVHNAAYWHLRPYLGLGPGAVSTIPVFAASDGSEHLLRLTGGSIFSYQQIHRGTLDHESELLSNRDVLFEHFMNGLRTRYGVSIGALRRRFDVDTNDLLRYLERSWSGFYAVDRRVNPADRLRLKSRQRDIVDAWLPELLELLEARFAPGEPAFRQGGATAPMRVSPRGTEA
ncbi:MAG: radical SAM family heme chaperone HemW [Spirochaetales bacterium]